MEGTDFLGGSSVFEFDWNVNIAKNLGLPVLLISTGIDKTFKEFDRNLEMAYKSFQNRDVQVIGIVANKIQEENVEALKQHLDKYLPENVEKIIVPLVSELQNPSIKEIVEELDAEVLVGKENLSNLTGKFAVGAMQLPNFLNHIDQNSLVITPGDRADIILGSLQAHISSKYPSVAGIVLTGGIKPEETIMRLIEGTQQNVPIVSVKNWNF